MAAVCGWTHEPSRPLAPAAAVCSLTARWKQIRVVAAGGLCRELRNLPSLQRCPVSVAFCLPPLPPPVVVSFLPFWVTQNNNDQIYPVKSSFTSQRDQSASQQWKVKFRFQFLLWLNSESLTLVERRKQEAWFLWSCISDCRVVAEEKSPSRPQSFFLIPLSSVFNETLPFPGKLKSVAAAIVIGIIKRLLLVSIKHIDQERLIAVQTSAAVHPLEHWTHHSSFLLQARRSSALN